MIIAAQEFAVIQREGIFSEFKKESFETIPPDGEEIGRWVTMNHFSLIEPNLVTWGMKLTVKLHYSPYLSSYSLSKTFSHTICDTVGIIHANPISEMPIQIFGCLYLNEYKSLMDEFYIRINNDIITGDAVRKAVYWDVFEYEVTEEMKNELSGMIQFYSLGK